jgi:hypothetical protein
MGKLINTIIAMFSTITPVQPSTTMDISGWDEVPATEWDDDSTVVRDRSDYHEEITELF